MARVAAPAEEVGVVVGTTTGGLGSGEEIHRRRRQGLRRGSRVVDWLETPISVAADQLAHFFSCGGPRLTVSTACSSGANALGIAADWIRDGRARAVLCGGADSLCRMTYSGFNSLQALDPAPCRPFDRARAGLSLGEGAAFFVSGRGPRAGAGATIPASSPLLRQRRRNII